jgi:hypothetical protein
MPADSASVTVSDIEMIASGTVSVSRSVIRPATGVP